MVQFIQASDIPGVNDFMPGHDTEEIFCSGTVEYAGQALGLIIAGMLPAHFYFSPFALF